MKLIIFDIAYIIVSFIWLWGAICLLREAGRLRKATRECITKESEGLYKLSQHQFTPLETFSVIGDFDAYVVVGYDIRYNEFQFIKRFVAASHSEEDREFAKREAHELADILNEKF